MSECKVCVKKRAAEYYSKNRDIRIAQKMEWRKMHPSYDIEYWNKNRDNRITQKKEWRKRHPECKAREYIKVSYGLCDPPQELIDLKAEQIRLFRAVRDRRMEVLEHEG